MNLLRKLKIHLKELGFNQEYESSISCFLKSRKDPAKTVNRILLMNRQEIIDRVIIPGTIKIIGQTVATNLRNGEYSLVRKTDKENDTFDIVVWTDPNVLIDNTDKVTLITEAINGFTADKLNLSSEWESFTIATEPDVKFFMKNFNLSKPIIEHLFSEFDKAFAGIDSWKTAIPTNIYYCKLI